MFLDRRTFLIGTIGSAGAFALDRHISDSPLPFGAVPTPRQLTWQRMERCAFIHFTVNTFTGKEWGYGDEDPRIFHPTAFDADAMILALKSAGMRSVILTCKHHDGFCLWPTKTTEHSIRHSAWQDGNGDIVREISDAARRQGLKFGVYVSPWDRNNPYYGKPEYIPIYQKQITELLSNYGAVFEVWFDGANGGDGFYGGAREKRTIDKITYYRWPETRAIVRRLQPEAVIFGDAGPDIRWIGNEKGEAAENCWATFDPHGEKGTAAAAGNIVTSESVSGTQNGKQWIPAECDVSIRPGWFWHEQENAQVKTPQKLMDLAYKSIGRGAGLLLNVPPDKRGIFSEPDVNALKGFGELWEKTFARNIAPMARVHASNVRSGSSRYRTENLLTDDLSTFWATDQDVRTAEVILNWNSPQHIAVIRIREAIQLGQRISGFALDIQQGDIWLEVAHAVTIGNCRLIPLEKTVATDKVRLRITSSMASIALAEFAVFTA